MVTKTEVLDRLNHVTVTDDGLDSDDLDVLASFINNLYLNQNTDSSTWDIARVCVSMLNFLMVKNKRYGNSAIEPLNVFSKLDANEQINNRMDDKLMRIKNSSVELKNDYVDLSGYLLLKCIANDWLEFKDLLD